MTQYDISQEIPRLGKRAEILASWYLRFNGYFPLKDFILHDAGEQIQPGGQLTDADLLAVRLPYTIEIIRGENEDITVKTHDKLDVHRGILDFVIAEVSSEACKFNWLVGQENEEHKSVKVEFLKYVMQRFGWWRDDGKIDQISDCLSKEKFYSEEQHVGANESIVTRVRLLSFGVATNPELPIQQISFAEMLDYMKCDLFGCYGQTDELKKIVSDHKQWDALIHEIYKRLLGHKHPEQSPEEIINWLFPSKTSDQAQ